MKAIYLLFAFQIIYQPIIGQGSQLRFKHYIVADGLSQADVYHITQDSRGFVWFGTFDGLNRFDGYNFKVFRPAYNKFNAIDGGAINSIIEDKEGMIWVGINQALNRYNYKTDRFEHFYVQYNVNEKFKVNYDPFFIDDKNELWFTYNFENLGSINLESGKVTTYDFAHGMLGEFTTANYPAKSFYRSLSKIYSVGADGLHIIDIQDKRTSFYFSSNLKNQIGKKTYIRQILQARDHVLWMASKDGLISYDPVTRAVQSYGSYKGLSSLATDADGNIWCGSYESGLTTFSTRKEKFIANYVKSPSDPNSIGENTVTAVFSDKDGNIWAGIDLDGIDKINPAYEQLVHVKINPFKANPAYSGSIWSIAEVGPNKVLVCANHEDLVVYDKNKAQSKKINLPGIDQEALLYQIIVDSGKRIWIGADKGVFYSDDQMKTVHSAVKKDFFYDVTLFEYNQKILIGTDQGLFFIPISKPAIGVDTVHLFDTKAINAFGRSPNGFLAVATGNEFFLLRAKHDRLLFVKKKAVDFVIKSILFQDESKVWFGTSTGLVKYDMVKNIFKIYTEKEGLSNNFVYCVLKGNDGNLWMSTNHGISKLDLSTGKFSNFDLQEGVQSLEFNAHSFFQSASGTIYFGGVKGFNFFNPAQIKTFDFAPPLELLNISVNNNPVSLKPFLEKNNNVKFNSKENNISVEFAAIDFNRNDNINYLYKLRAGDDWASIGKRRTLSFANLSPGDYHLEVKAQNSNNKISPHTLKMAFTVLAPFYETPWFIGMTILIITVIVYRVYRYRINQILKLQVIRNTIAQDLHDDIGSTLGSINIYSEVAANRLERRKPGQVKEVLEKIRLSSRETIERMNDIVWSIDSRNDNYEKLYYRMHAFTAVMFTSREISFSFILHEDLNKVSLDMKQRRNIFLIYKESIYNIVKYADCKKVWISLDKQGNYFKMFIRDDGKGFDLGAVAAYNGNGIENMKARAKDIAAKLAVSSVISEGTQIAFEMKL